MRFKSHGIQDCLVFDEPQRLVKRGRHLSQELLNTIDESMHRLKEAAKKLGVPIWHAPAEAEAECANMERLGTVDVV